MLNRSCKIGSLLVSLVFLPSCWWTFGGSKVLTRVGDYEITEQDVKYRNEVIQQYYPQETRKLGRHQLRKAYVVAQILKNNGVELDQKALETEAERIDKTSLMPDALQQIKDIFGDDRASYLKVYILPVLSERLIYFNFFLYHPKIQEPSKLEAQKLLAEGAKGEGAWEKALADRGLRSGKFSVTLSEGLIWQVNEREGPGRGSEAELPMQVQQKMAEEKATQISEEGKQWLERIKTLKPGQVVGEVIDAKEFWLVSRYLGPDPKVKDKWLFSGTHFPKADYGKWLAEETAKVVIEELVPDAPIEVPSSAPADKNP